MTRTDPAPRVEVVSARDDARQGKGRKVINRIVFVDDVDCYPESPVNILVRTRVERSGHFTPPRFG